MRKIVLVTVLDPMIADGGRRQEVAEWTAGPLNLLRAIKLLRVEKSENIRAFGSIGGGESWLEVCGKRFDLYDFLEFGIEDARRFLKEAGQTTVEKHQAAA